MPYVVNELLDIATKAGYKKLYAVVEPVNVKSSSLLKRTGFNLLGIRSMEMRFMGKPTGEHKLFEIYEHLLY
jgi:L-amino acid N-acyltransferase YncA